MQIRGMLQVGHRGIESVVPQPSVSPKRRSRSPRIRSASIRGREEGGGGEDNGSFIRKSLSAGTAGRHRTPPLGPSNEPYVAPPEEDLQEDPVAVFNSLPSARYPPHASHPPFDSPVPIKSPPRHRASFEGAEEHPMASPGAQSQRSRTRSGSGSGREEEEEEEDLKEQEDERVQRRIPLNIKERLIRIQYIGGGASGRVHKCLFVGPPLRLVAVKVSSALAMYIELPYVSECCC